MIKREYELGKARVWTLYYKSIDWVKQKYGFGKV